MSVFTPVERNELVALPRNYDAGELVCFEGVSDGTGLDHPTDMQCATPGATMARLHPAGQDFTQTRENDRGHDWHFPRPGEITHRKDPNAFRRIMQQRSTPANPPPLQT